MYFIPYNKNLKQYSRNLRNNSTFGEVLLWNELKAKRFMGFTFNRQKPLDRYIVDFYCKKIKLVIEVDGISHQFEEVKLKDEIRTKKLNELGLTLIRFTEKEVRFHRVEVLRKLENFILDYEESLLQNK